MILRSCAISKKELFIKENSEVFKNSPPIFKMLQVRSKKLQKANFSL